MSSLGRKSIQHQSSKVLFWAIVSLGVWSRVAFAQQLCSPGWCNVFPVGPVKVIPPVSGFWNKLDYIPDVDKFFLYTSDGIVTFSNSWWSYQASGHVASSNPWVEESTSGTEEATDTDNSKGFLMSGISASDRIITLRAGEGASFHPDAAHGGVLTIENEEIGYTASNRSKDTFAEVVRGIRGTAAASHAAGTVVNAGAPFPQSRIGDKLVPVTDHIPDRHPFLTSAYDSKRHQLIQAGGIVEANKKTDTWYFCFSENEFCSKSDIRTWKPLLSHTPVPGRADSAMTYDSDDDIMVLYGGQNVGNPNADTWLLCFKADPQAGGSSVGCPRDRIYPDWVRVASKGSPDRRFAHSIVYDSFAHVAVLFGGTNATPSDPRETWIYSPRTSTWTNAKPAGQNPSAFRRPAMTYDSTRRRIVLYEGPPGKVTDGVMGGLFLYDAGANKWEACSIPGGPIPTSGGSASHGRLSMDYDPKADIFVATEAAPPYGIQIWELKGSALNAC